MIESKTLDLALQLAANHSTETTAILPVPGTAVSEIAATLGVDGIVDINDKEGILAYINGSEDHTVCLQQTKELAVRAVRQLNDVIRNVINPHILLLCSERQMRPVAGSFSVTGFDVETHECPEYLKSQILLELISAWKGKDIRRTSTLGKGIGEFDKDVIISTLTERFPIKTNIEQNAEVIVQLLAGRTAVETVVDTDVRTQALFVIHFIDTPPPGVNSSLDDWKFNRGCMAAQLAEGLELVIKRWEMSERNNGLYVQPTDQDRKIHVNKNVYRKLLTAGATAETIIGNELLGRRFTPNELMIAENVTACNSRFEQEANLRKASNKAKEDADWIELIREIVNRDAERIAKEEAWPVAGDSLEKVKGRLNEVCNKILGRENIRNEREEDVIAAILLAVWYAHTDAARLMDLAAKAAEEDPELTADEVFTIAKIQYAGLFVARQLNVTKITSDAE